eukprot:361095-Chlamydomonas_euryale.AAC.21
MSKLTCGNFSCREQARAYSGPLLFSSALNDSFAMGLPRAKHANLPQVSEAEVVINGVDST